MKNTIAALALVLVMFSTADVMAGEEVSATKPQDFFERLDANQDGQVTFAEAPAECCLISQNHGTRFPG